ncbi:MAG: hypothetical protein FD134_2193 [Gallionellaceae bacterium]|nr:MAG: hypothetical protein FD134_2193 [Gallionellaceae bacterium]
MQPHGIIKQNPRGVRSAGLNLSDGRSCLPNEAGAFYVMGRGYPDFTLITTSPIRVPVWR